MIWCVLVIIFICNMLSEWIFVALGFVIVFTLISYLKPSKEWGKLLFYTRRPPLEIMVGLVFMGLVVYTMIDAAQNGWNDSVLYTGNPAGIEWLPWVRAVMILIVLGLTLLPDRVYENGFRDSVRFESWACVESMEIQKGYRVKIALKKPTLRRIVYLNLKPEDRLPVMARNKISG